jgi:SEC-C motif-containing protein
MFCPVQLIQRSKMSKCPCQSGKEYDACCGPIISGSQAALTAEALMRSRYSAFAKGEVDYLGRSLHPDQRADYDPGATQRWANHSEWVNLQILNISGGGTDDDEGTVEFIATYRQKGNTLSHHEVGQFNRLNGIWYYTDGKIVTPGTVRHESPKVGRNDPCPCGSGKKYKKCCG